MSGEESLYTLYREYAAGPWRLEEAVSGLTVEQLNQTPAPGKWSIRQIVAHLADTELEYTHRMRKVMAEKSGLLTGFNQDDWVNHLSAGQMPVNESLQLIKAIRAWHGSTLQAVDESVFSYVGTHESDGEMTVLDLLQKVTSHLYHHMQQIDKIRQSF